MFLAVRPGVPARGALFLAVRTMRDGARLPFLVAKLVVVGSRDSFLVAIFAGSERGAWSQAERTAFLDAETRP